MPPTECHPGDRNPLPAGQAGAEGAGEEDPEGKIDGALADPSDILDHFRSMDRKLVEEGNN